MGLVFLSIVTLSREQSLGPYTGNTASRDELGQFMVNESFHVVINVLGAMEMDMGKPIGKHQDNYTNCALSILSFHNHPSQDGSCKDCMSLVCTQNKRYRRFIQVIYRCHMFAKPLTY